MAGKIQTIIPRYGELNRICRDYIDNYAFSFDRQEFISDFYQQYSGTESFESVTLELVLNGQKEQYTLILNSLKSLVAENKLVLIINRQPISEWFKEQWKKLKRGLYNSVQIEKRSRGFRK